MEDLAKRRAWPRLAVEVTAHCARLEDRPEQEVNRQARHAIEDLWFPVVEMARLVAPLLELPVAKPEDDPGTRQHVTTPRARIRCHGGRLVMPKCVGWRSRTVLRLFATTPLRPAAVAIVPSVEQHHSVTEVPPPERCAAQIDPIGVFCLEHECGTILPTRQ